MRRGQNTDIESSLKDLIPTLVDDFEGSKPTMENKQTNKQTNWWKCGRIAREFKLEIDPEDLTKSLQPHNKTLMDKELLPIV